MRLFRRNPVDPPVNWISLGTVTSPSGVLVILDMGYLRFWSGMGEPQPPLDDLHDAMARAKVASSADFVITGRDAAEVARIADLQSFHFIYDIPADGIETITSKIATIAAERGLDARLEPESRRIPHRERAQRAADLGGGDFVMSGPWVAVVGGNAIGPLTVRGRRDDYGGHVGSRWTEVSIGLERGAATSTKQIGYFGVDYGLCLVGDADALSHWRHFDNRDGLFDVAFWGRDQQEAARELGAQSLADSSGWTSIKEDEAKERFQQVRAWLNANSNRKLVVEPRPHTNYYHVLEQIRRSDNQVGSVELGGARLLGLSTSWGDGIFPVWVDRNQEGDVVATRIELGGEKRRQLMEQVWQRGSGR